MALLLSTPLFAEPNSFVLRSEKTTQKVVALTFDDGPDPYYTPKILAILKKTDTKATFFLVAQQIERFPEVARAILDNGHEIGNHSYNHIDYSIMSASDALDDVYKSQTTFFKLLNYFPIYFRPPYGRLNVAMTPYLKRYYQHTVDWSIDTRDWDPQCSNKFARDVVEKNLHPGAIILCHDNNDRILQELPNIIRHIKNSGYKLVNISELIQVKQS